MKRTKSGQFVKGGGKSRRSGGSRKKARRSAPPPRASSPRPAPKARRTKIIVRDGSPFGGGGGGFFARAMRALPKVARLVTGVSVGIVAAGRAAGPLATKLPPMAVGPVLVGGGLALGFGSKAVGGILPIVTSKDVEAVALGVAINGSLRTADSLPVVSRAGGAARVAAGLVSDVPKLPGTRSDTPGYRRVMQLQALNN